MRMQTSFDIAQARKREAEIMVAPSRASRSICSRRSGWLIRGVGEAKDTA
jgi:hypothetical protein